MEDALCCFFFQAEDGIRDVAVTGVQTCALPILSEVPEVTPAKPVDQAIPLPQIADRAEQLDHLLREISSQLMPKHELLESERTAEVQAAEIHRRATETRDLLAGTPTPMELEDEQRFWRSQSLEFGAARRLLTSRAAKLEEQMQTLEAQQPEWLATWIQIHESPGKIGRAHV